MIKVLTVLSTILFAGLGHAQTNLLRDPEPISAAQAKWTTQEDRLQKISRTPSWTSFGNTEILFEGDEVLFVVRNGGHIHQDVDLSPTDIGKHALLIAVANSDRVFANDDITDHPYLYGYMMDTPNHIISYLQGERMLWESQTKDQWKCIFGAFPIPEKTVQIRFFLKQAHRRGTDRDGSAARFKKVGLYLFDSASEAKEFTHKYCGQ